MYSKSHYSKFPFFNSSIKKDYWPYKPSDFFNLENNCSVISEHFRNSDNVLKGVYCQDSFMKDVLNFYPDRLCIDVTHKCLENDLYMYVFLCEDSNGLNEIISFGFSTNDDSEYFLWLLNTFKKHNPNWRKIKLIALDAEIKHKDILRSIFPTPHMVICFHHAFKSFRKGLEIIKNHYTLASEQIQYAIELFKSMYNAHSQAEYEIYYQQFLVLHGSLVMYFQEVWVTMQHLWRTGLDFFHENVFSSLNCCLETLDFTIKAMFFSEIDLLKFLKKLFVMLSVKRIEKANLLSVSHPLMYSRFSIEYQISKVLTPYASKFVIDQYGLSSEIHMDCSILSDSYYFDNLGSPVNASISVCQCQFYLYTYLPCRHIFAVRKILSLNAFDETMIEYNWTMKYYQSTLSSLQGAVNAINNVNLTDPFSKYKFISNLLEVSLPPLFESMHISESRINLLTKLVTFWKDNKEVHIEFGGIEPEYKVVETDCDTVLNDDKISSQLCKIEADLTDDESSMYMSANKTELSKKLPMSSKVFKMEYASLTYKGTANDETQSLSSSPILNESSYKQSKWNFKSKVLDGHHVNYAYLCRIICDSKETCIDWLRQMELICTSMLCPTCGCAMTMKLQPRLSDGAVWVCSDEIEIKKSCSRRCSIRRGSWFELTNMSFDQILNFCYMWINGFSQNQIISETGISTATYISWNKLSTRICEVSLMDDLKYSTMSKLDSPSHPILSAWLQKCGDEDSFLKFLQDANAMHRKDSVKHSMG